MFNSLDCYIQHNYYLLINNTCDEKLAIIVTDYYHMKHLEKHGHPSWSSYDHPTYSMWWSYTFIPLVHKRRKVEKTIEIAKVRNHVFTFSHYGKDVKFFELDKVEERKSIQDVVRSIKKTYDIHFRFNKALL